MEGSPDTYRLFVGLDVAAQTATAAWQPSRGGPGPPHAVDQTPAGHAALPRQRRTAGIPPAETLVVREATGRYWVALAVALHAGCYRVAVINPLRAHHVARAHLRRAKTDDLDAQALAQLAAALRPAPWTPPCGPHPGRRLAARTLDAALRPAPWTPPAVYHEVRPRLVAREGLLAMRTQARNQRHALRQWPVVVAAVRHHCDAVIGDLDTRIADLTAAIAAVLEAGAWAESLACLTSAPGIGLVTATWLLVATLACVLGGGPAAVTAYAGLALMPRESGRTVRGRSSIGHGGNARLRTALYMATRSAALHKPVIKPFYDRLRAAGKPVKVARCAAARKLLHLAWALATKRQRFDPMEQQHMASPNLAA